MKTWIFDWVASKALAATTGGIEIQNPLSCEEATECVQQVLNGLVFLAAPVVAIMILVGGFQIMASGGNEEKLSAGKKTIMYAVVGYAIILLASGAAALIRDVVSGGTAGAPPPGTPPPAAPPPPDCPLSCDFGKVCVRDSSGRPTCVTL